MLVRLNKLELAARLLQNAPDFLDADEATELVDGAKILERAIEAQHSLLNPILSSIKHPQQSLSALDANLFECTLRRNALEVELIRQAVSVCKLLTEVLHKLDSQVYLWKDEQFEYVRSWIETITLKMVSIEEYCMRHSYSQEKLERLRVISGTLEQSLERQQKAFALQEAELARYRRLPEDLVQEYAHIHGEIAKYKDYFHRLQ